MRGSVGNESSQINQGDVLKSGRKESSVLITDFPVIGCVILITSFTFAGFYSTGLSS